jgi:DNA repair photolyase
MPDELRWKLADQAAPQATLFAPALRVVGKGEFRGLEFLEVDAKTIINKVPGGPRFGSGYTINAYRGCSHACAYCFARPTHEYLGLGIGDDFDRKIVVKRNAVEVVRAETSPSRWGGDLIAMGTNTDPYQPAEGKYRLTRGIIEVLAERRNPFSILTKSPLVLRDLDLLVAAAAHSKVRVDFSVGTVDTDTWKLTEPGTPHPERRLDAVAKLNAAGVPAGVLMGPILPGLSDAAEQIAAVVRGAVAAGAVGIGHVVLHLGPGIRDHYLALLADHRPDLTDRYQEWYRRRNAPAATRERVAELVATAIAECGGPQRRRRAEPREPSAEPAKDAQPARNTQLNLGM